MMVPKSISTGAQYVTPDSKIYCEKVKMCWFSSGIWFFCIKFVQLAVVGKRCNYGFVCIIAVLYPWYYTAVLYNSLKPNEYYTVRMSPLRSPNESVSNGPLRSPNESDVESVEFRLQRIRGLLACYKV